MPITRNDVAKLAGVSTATVSYVINNGPRPVSEETRQKVLAAIDELGYQPSEIARSLKTKRTTTIGVVVSDILNPILSAIAKSIEDTILPMGYNMILCNSDENPERELTFLRMLVSKQVDGILLLPTGENIDYIINQIIKKNKAIVLMDRNIEVLASDSILFDNVSGAYQATKHLIELGHKRIGFIGLPCNLTPGCERKEGYEKAHKEAGIPIDSELVLEGSFKATEGHRLVEMLMNKKHPPSALLVSSNRLLEGVLQYVKEDHLSIPEDLALIVFDDVHHFSYFTPSITAVDCDKELFGREAALLLRARITNDVSNGSQVIRIPCQLVIRESTTGVMSTLNHAANTSRK